MRIENFTEDYFCKLARDSIIYSEIKVNFADTVKPIFTILALF